MIFEKHSNTVTEVKNNSSKRDNIKMQTPILVINSPNIISSVTTVISNSTDKKRVL